MPNNPLESNSSDLTLCDSTVLRNIFWRILWISKWISFGWRIHYIKVLWSLVLFWSFRHNKQAKSTSCIENTSENAEEEFHFRWLKSKGIFVAFPFSITPFFNLIKWKLSKRYRKLMNGRIVELFQVSFKKLILRVFSLSNVIFWKSDSFQNSGLPQISLWELGVYGDFDEQKSQFPKYLSEKIFFLCQILLKLRICLIWRRK